MSNTFLSFHRLVFVVFVKYNFPSSEKKNKTQINRKLRKPHYPIECRAGRYGGANVLGSGTSPKTD